VLSVSNSNLLPERWKSDRHIQSILGVLTWTNVRFFRMSSKLEKMNVDNLAKGIDYALAKSNRDLPLLLTRGASRISRGAKDSC